MSEPIRSLIVDDEELARELLRSMLDEHTSVEVVAEYADGESALRGIRQHDPDLVFLDVQMPVMTGIEMLQHMDPEEIPAVIFVTAYDQFALRAFEVNAVDYLLKPFDEERLDEAVSRMNQRKAGELARQTERVLSLLGDMAPGLGSPALQRIAVKQGEKTLLRHVDSIEWLEAEGKYVRLHMVGGDTDLIRETMINLSEGLNPSRFYRVSRSAIINMDHVKEIHTWFHGDLAIIMSSGDQVNTTRAYRDAIKKVLDNRSG